MKFNTKTIHAGVEPDPSTGAIMTPIYQTSTYVQTRPGEHKGFEYSRTQNPTRQALEENLAALENGKHGICFGSGLAAIDALIKLLEPGDEVISTSDLYGGTYRKFKQVFEKYGIVFHFIPMRSAEEVKEYLNDKTRMVWLETPTNPMMNVIDIQGISELAKEHDAIVVTDNTFASPYLQRPLDLGSDVVMHSATKYLGGHSDVVHGALMMNDDELAERLYFLQGSSGAVPGPQDCFLVLRGVKTLHLRMQRHCENARKVVDFLRSHDKVENIHWPGLPEHPGHELAKKQMDDFGGMISFDLKGNDQEAAFEILSNVRLFALAESLGGVESLMNHPASMTHASIPKEEREKTGLVDSLIRISVGVEDGEDLIEDLEQAFQKSF